MRSWLRCAVGAEGPVSLGRLPTDSWSGSSRSCSVLRLASARSFNEQASVNLAAELLGRTNPKVTVENYIAALST